MSRLTLPIAVASVFLVTDQVTKVLVRRHLLEDVVLIPGIFQLQRTQNYGAAFGILRNLPEDWRIPFFVVMTLLAVVAVSFLMLSVPARRYWTLAAYGGVLGGALGNFIDRVWFGSVTDFLAVHYYDHWQWPNFNVADMGISVGMVVIIADLLLIGPGEVGGVEPEPGAGLGTNQEAQS